jgi:hypothetical protein
MKDEMFGELVASVREGEATLRGEVAPSRKFVVSGPDVKRIRDLAVFDVETLEPIEGDLPGRAYKLVREWAAQYQSELLRMWQTQDLKKLPGLE